MASHFMTEPELEQLYIKDVRFWANVVARKRVRYCDKALESLDNAQTRLVEEFGYSWEQVEQMEIAAYKAATA